MNYILNLTTTAAISVESRILITIAVDLIANATSSRGKSIRWEWNRDE